MRRLHPVTAVGIAAATLMVSTVLILTQVDSYSVLDEQDLAIPRGSERIANLQMQAAREHMQLAGGLGSAINRMDQENLKSKARMQRLVHSDWLQDIYGKDTTYDLKYITSLKPGDVSVAGYEGLPQEKGGLPDSKELAAADALLTHAISTQTMPDGIDKVWDGKPYVPDDALKEKLSKAWAGFHQAVGEKRWEKKVYEKCGQAGTLDPACQEVLGGKHEGYDTKWDGEQWTQWNGVDWVKLEPDA